MENQFVLFIIPVVLILFLVIGLYLYLKERKIRSNGKKTTATVIEIRKEQSQQDVSYRFVVEFRNSNGKKIVQEINNTVSNRPKEKVPFKVPIIYLEKNESTEIILAKDKSILIIALSMSFFAILMLVFFVLYISEIL
jgi:hypothetical protein